MTGPRRTARDRRTACGHIRGHVRLHIRAGDRDRGCAGDRDCGCGCGCAGDRDRGRGFRRVLTVLGLAVVALLATALPASAHATLTSSSPVGGAALDTAPDRVTLAFSESVSIKSDAIRVIGPSGARVDEGDSEAGGSASEATVALRPGLGPGTYVVSWRVVSADSHPVGGAFAFGIGGPPDAGAAAAVASGGGGSRAVGVSLGVARLVAFVGAALLIGATFFVGILWPAGARRPGPVRLIAAGWLLSLVGALGMLLFQGPYSAGTGMSSILSLDPLAVTLDSRYGQLLAIRLLALLLAVPLLRRLSVSGDADTHPAGEGGGTGRRGLVELAGLGLVLVTTMAMIGHASAGNRVWLATTVMTVHTTAMAIWLGGLCVLGLTVLDGSGRDGRPQAGPGPGLDQSDQSDQPDSLTGSASRAGPFPGTVPGADVLDLDRPVEPGWAGELARVLPRWSRTATIAIVLIVLTGTVQAFREVGAFGALFDTTYGRLLLYKLWFVLGVLGLGLLARRWVHRHFRSAPAEPVASAEASASTSATGSAEVVAPTGPTGTAVPVTSLAVTGLRRGVVFEVVVGAAVLAVTSVLVNTVPGRDSYAPPFSRTAIAGPLTVDVEVSPTRTGLQTMHIYTYDPQGRPQRLVEASGELSLPSAGVGPLEVPLAEVTDGHAVAEGVAVPLPGEWQLRFTLRINDFDQYVTTVFYTVR